MGYFNFFLSMASRYPFQPIDEVMTKKAHGTTKNPPQDNLRYGVDEKKPTKSAVSHVIVVKPLGTF